MAMESLYFPGGTSVRAMLSRATLVSPGGKSLGMLKKAGVNIPIEPGSQRSTAMLPVKVLENPLSLLRRYATW